MHCFSVFVMLLPMVVSIQYIAGTAAGQAGPWSSLLQNIAPSATGQQMYLQKSEIISQRDLIGQFPTQKFVVTGPDRVYYRRILTPIYAKPECPKTGSSDIQNGAVTLCELADGNGNTVQQESSSPQINTYGENFNYAATTYKDKTAETKIVPTSETELLSSSYSSGKLSDESTGRITEKSGKASTSSAYNYQSYASTYGNAEQQYSTTYPSQSLGSSSSYSAYSVSNNADQQHTYVAPATTTSTPATSTTTTYPNYSTSPSPSHSLRKRPTLSSRHSYSATTPGYSTYYKSQTGHQRQRTYTNSDPYYQRSSSNGKFEIKKAQILSELAEASALLQELFRSRLHSNAKRYNLKS